jgi:protein-L-isoaspartate(D-aspartate) O-methyltransferase
MKILWNSSILLLQLNAILIEFSLLRVRSSCWAYQSPHHQTNTGNSKQKETSMRAWTCHGRNQRDMVDRLRQAGIVRSDAVAAVMTLVDRRYYVPRATTATAITNPLLGVATLDPPPYQDSPIPIGLGQTISAPHMHAHALEELLPYLVTPAASSTASSSVTVTSDGTTSTATAPSLANNDTPPLKLLDVGCGSGYLTACLGRWLKPRDDTNSTNATESSSSSTAAAATATSILGRRGRVFGIDIQRHLVEMTRTNIMSNDADLLRAHGDNEPPVVTLATANGWEGLPNEAPFDAIHVGASAATIPTQLVAQLKVGGVMIVPIGPAHGSQALYKIERLHNRQNNSTTDSSKAESKDEMPDASLQQQEDEIQSTTLTFDATEYRITQLLGVRYVPLIEQPPAS